MLLCRVMRHFFCGLCGTINRQPTKTPSPLALREFLEVTYEKERSEKMAVKTKKLKYIFEDKRLEIALLGEIDHHNAAELRREADELIRRCKPDIVVLNLEKIDFMDSSGLGFIMGRMALAGKNGGTLIIKSPSRSVQKICRLAGLERLVKIEK